MQRNEPGVAAHHPLVTFGGRMDLVDRVRGGGHRGIEAKRRDGATNVVVDRLGHANDWKSFLPQRQDDAERAFAADRHESIQPIRAKGFEQLIRPIQFRPRPVRLLHAPVERITTIRRAENRAAEVRDPANLVGAQRHELALAQQAPESPPDSDAFPTAMDGAQHDGPDDGIQPRRVTAAGGDPNSHRLLEGVLGPAAPRINRSTSPGSACRLVVFLEKTRCPSTSTSKTPPDDWISRTSACGKASRSSAARPVARGS